MSDAENKLIAQVIAGGDKAAFGGLVERHQGRLRGYLLRLTRGDRDLSDDLSQEVFLTAFRKIKSYSGEGTFSAWLYRIAYTRFLMHIRKTKAQAKREGLWEGARENTVWPSDTSLDLERALAALRPEESSALTLCFSHGYTHEEAAGIMDMPVGTLKSHIARGKKNLAKRLAHLKRDYA